MDTHLERARAFAKGIPAATKATAGLLTAVYVLELLARSLIRATCLSPALVLWRLQVWRLLTGQLVHVGIIHLLLNLLAFIPLGSALERSMGSVRFAHLLAVLVVAQDAIFLAIAYSLAIVGIRAPYRACAAGFSGPIFALMAVEAAAAGSARRSLFGVLEIPAPLIPWASLGVVQVLVPGASFTAHLAGLLAGEAWATGLLAAASPSDAAVARAEAHPWCERTAATLGGAVAAHPGALPVWQASGAAGDGSGHEATSAVGAAWRLGSRGSAAAWARLPPATKEALLQRWQVARLITIERWRQLVAALPPPVVAAATEARTAAAAFLSDKAPALAAWLRRGGRERDGEDEEGGADGGAAGGERAPLLSGSHPISVSWDGSAAGSHGGTTGGALAAGIAAGASPARRARPAGAAAEGDAFNSGGNKPPSD